MPADVLAYLLAAVCVGCFATLAVLWELEDRRDARRDREHREWLEAYGKWARRRVHELCQPRVPARRP